VHYSRGTTLLSATKREGARSLKLGLESEGPKNTARLEWIAKPFKASPTGPRLHVEHVLPFCLLPKLCRCAIMTARHKPAITTSLNHAILTVVLHKIWSHLWLISVHCNLATIKTLVVNTLSLITVRKRCNNHAEKQAILRG